MAPSRSSPSTGSDFTGKNVLITGANSGIGLAIATAFMQLGANIAITARTAKRNKQIAKVLSGLSSSAVHHFSADLSRPQVCETVIDRAERAIGPLDILINNAAHFAVKPLAEVGAEDVVPMFAVNVYAPLLCGRAFATKIADRNGSGVIVNISSISSYRPFAGYGIYSATKASLNSLTKSMAVEWGHMGIRVNGVAPGHVRTDGILADIQRGRLNYKKMTENIPLGTIATPAQIADLVIFLSGPGSSHISGHTVVIDGGQTSRL
jgi:NAD(P)-dependent dehydrogenase (short-subunit alcohol dehydrogenase family)